MSPLLLALASFYALTVVNCAAPPAPRLSDFTAQVLRPLAVAQADAIVTEGHARIDQAYHGLPWGMVGAAASSLGAGPWAGILTKVLDQVHTLNKKQALAALDAQRGPLAQQAFLLLTERVKVEGGVYRVCWAGTERRYEDQYGQFVRLPDGPGPCPVIPLTVEAR